MNFMVQDQMVTQHVNINQIVTEILLSPIYAQRLFSIYSL